jgi:hypothetical protein
LTHKAESLERDLAGPHPTPLEQLLADRAVACWLQMQYADASYAQARDVSIKHLEYLGRRQTQAHRRFLTALGALATVRKLLPTPIPAPSQGGDTNLRTANHVRALTVFDPGAEVHRRQARGT